MTTKPTTAREAYEQNRRDIDRLLDWLHAELDTHQQRALAEPRDYGFAGDLGHIRALLNQAVAFLVNCETDDIETQLNQ